MAGPSDELNGTPEHVLAHSPHERRVDRSWRRGSCLKGIVLRSNFFPLANEHRWKPVGVEHVNRRIDQQPSLNRAHQLAGAANRDVAWTGHVNDGVVRPVRDQTSSAPASRKPRWSRVSDTPDAQLVLLGLSADKGCLERHRWSEAAELVRVQQTTAIELETQDPLVRDSAFGQFLHRRKQKPKSGRPSVLRCEGSLKCGGQSLVKELRAHQQGPRLRWPVSLDVSGEVRWVGVSECHRRTMARSGPNAHAFRRARSGDTSSGCESSEDCP